VRTTLVIVGVILVAVGVVWFLQGSGHLAGSFMSGSRFWEWTGVVAIVAGVIALARGVFWSRTRGVPGA
jgi:hypothetical protein